MPAKKDDMPTIGKMDVLGFDPGNAYIKWVDAYGNVKRMPSYIGEILDEQQYQEELNKPESVVITYENRRYVIGERAKQLNCPPMFKEGKSNKAHLMVMAVIAHVGFQVQTPTIHNLRVLVEDHRDADWEKFKKLLDGQTIKFEYRQASWSAMIDKVTLIPEGLPPYLWAATNNQFKFPDKSQGVIDFGGGAMTARLISPGGRINWMLSKQKKGINDLARRIAYRLERDNGISESIEESVIMSAMEAGLKYRQAGFTAENDPSNPFVYTHAGNDYYFHDIYDEERLTWFKALGRYLMREVWYGEQLGEVLLIGGGAYHAEIMEEMTGGRFFIPKNKEHPDTFAQVINAYALSNPSL